MTAPPDFIGIGTHLSGALWWAGLLGDHPLVHAPADGQWPQDFFVPFCSRPMTDDDVAAYHARFPRRGPGVVGEWSQRYLYDAWTLPLLRRAAPDARLLVMLRDPAERYRAALSIRLGEEREHGKWISMTDFVHRARYATQLQTLFAFFDPAQVLVLQYEQCLAAPLAQYERTLRFLGVEPGRAPQRIRRLQRRRRLRLRPVRPTPKDQRTVELWPDVLTALRTELAPEIAALEQLAPEVDTRLWRDFWSTAA